MTVKQLKKKRRKKQKTMKSEFTSVCIHVEIFYPDAKEWILDLSTGAWVGICCAHWQDALVSGNVFRKRCAIHRLAKHTHQHNVKQCCLKTNHLSNTFKNKELLDAVSIIPAGRKSWFNFSFLTVSPWVASRNDLTISFNTEQHWYENKSTAALIITATTT